MESILKSNAQLNVNPTNVGPGKILAVPEKRVHEMAPIIPIQHLSFSALKTYLSNPAGFYRQYVMKQYDNDLSPAALVGRTIHKQMESFYKQLTWEKSLEITASFFNENVRLVTDWKKTGSPEKSWNEAMAGIRDLKRAIPKRKIPKQEDKIVLVETAMTSQCAPAIPLKVIPDLVIEKKVGLDAYDWKKVSAFNDTPPAMYWIQAFFIVKPLEKMTGKFVRSVTFVEIKPKLAQVADLSETIRTHVIPNNPSSIEFRAILRLINFMLEDISGYRRHFLPNVTDMYAGDDEWIRWLEETNNDPAYAL